MSDIKLMPCPLCQSIHVCIMQTSEQDVDSQKYYGFCYNCCAEAGLGDTEEQAAEAWNALPRHLRWTTETPTEPGWYFVRYKGKVTICRADYPKGSPYMTYRVVGSPGAWMVTEHADEWAGPIPEPQEQP